MAGTPPMKVLLADDEKTITTTLGDALEAEGYEVTLAHSGDEAANRLSSDVFDCVITDVRMPGLGGIELLRLVRERHPETFVVVVTGYGTIEGAVEAMKIGAYDFVTKPFLNEEIVKILANIREVTDLRRENERLRRELYGRYSFGSLVGRSEAMQKLFAVMETVAASDFDVLISGERGTGKELVARGLHYNSRRREQPFVTLNCGAIAETLIESELFGHRRGAFTDAREDREGRFEAANGGTIFLDEITELRPDLQARLLRVLQEKEVTRLGEHEARPVDVRVMAASNRDLAESLAEGRLRADLYDRLNVLPLHLPPLRMREGDIELLVQHFLERHGGGVPFEIDRRLLAELCCYGWPGNVRELENTVKRLIALSGGEHNLTRQLLELLPGPGPGARGDVATPVGLVPTLGQVVEQAEKKYIQEVLRKTQNQKSQTAEILGISRKNLWEKMKRYELE